MLKQLTIAVLVGTLLPACILTTDDTTTSISETSSSDGTTVATSTDPTTGLTDPSDGTTDAQTTDATTTSPTTTDGTTTAPTTTDGTTTDATDGTTTDGTTGQGGAYGQCGWYAEEKYYACAPDGGVASLEDPDMISPIACPDGLEEGAKCSEDEGPVKGVGCCTTEGTLYFCDSLEANVIIKQECGV